MRIAFLTEMNFSGKIPANYSNMRTEFAWMHALNADHYNIHLFASDAHLVNYDHVFIVFPKGIPFLNSTAVELIKGINPISELLQQPIVQKLKQKGNKNIHYVQEGPHWFQNDYNVEDQINFYNFIESCDSIFTHNESDVPYYKGLFWDKEVRIIGTLMIDTLIKDITPIKENKAIIGGNFARWYGGFESFIVAGCFECDIWAQTSHAMRDGEGMGGTIKHLPRLIWEVWMRELAKFKYAVHLMPTVAAGTFALNCAYFGIPCIGNNKVDTQKLCHPELSVDVENIDVARRLALELRDNPEFYEKCSNYAKEAYQKYYTQDVWTNKIKNYLENGI